MSDDNGNEIATPADKITFWTQDTFTDLCRGPHVKTRKEINPDAISITFKPPAGHTGVVMKTATTDAHLWHGLGDARTIAGLSASARRGQKARSSRHRRKARLCSRSVRWSARVCRCGNPTARSLRDTLERWLRETQIDNGYLPVVTPHIGKLDLYNTSGHYPYYKDSQYAPIQVDDEEFLLKPMNCPHHIMIYKSELRSYRDLPMRLAEFGTVYRYEQSGELNGLTRVRGFTVDDAHLFVAPDQLLEEFKKVVGLIQNIFNSLGLTDFRARVGTRDPDSDKYVGDDELWEQATSAIIQACEELELALHCRGRRSGFLWAEAGLYGARCAQARMAVGHGAGGLQPARTL